VRTRGNDYVISVVYKGELVMSLDMASGVLCLHRATRAVCMHACMRLDMESNHGPPSCGACASRPMSAMHTTRTVHCLVSQLRTISRAVSALAGQLMSDD
jgi:hypothetical protein